MQLQDDLSSIVSENVDPILLDHEPERRLEEAPKQEESGGKGPSKKSLDEAIKKLKIMTVSMGFPEPGNLRSKNTKEVAKTLKCFAEILKQRDQDLNFRSSVNDRV